MESAEQLNILALKFICGEIKTMCRLCLCCTLDEASISLERNVKVQTSYCHDLVSLETMLEKLGVPNEPLLPQVLCNNCATTLINSYLFQKLSEFSNYTWNTVCKMLDQALSQSGNLNSQIKSVCVVISKTENNFFTSSQRCIAKTKRKITSKVNKIVQSQKSEIIVNKDDFICDECGKIFRARYLLTKHMINHKETRYQCPDCPKEFRLPMYLKIHAERVHYHKKIQCSKCPKKFSTKRVLKHHLASEHIPINCDKCKIELPSKKALIYHLNHHKVNTCPHCNKEYRNFKYFKFHKKYCGKVGTPEMHICDICKKVYQAKHGLRSHIKTEHGFGDVISCKWCNKKFDAISRLNDHIVTHTKEKKFHCDKCGGNFVSRKSLDYHTRLHTGERPYPCNLCSESFLSVSRRLEHQKRKHFEPAHKCSLCNAKFVSTFEKRKHLQRHFNPRSKLYITESDYIR